ncbi:TIR domain-containing protein [Saccharopolyspora sp. K220]|uniref:effector-associated domain 2-containing protein n=1 Tax=Saccharopolyspora soli TaxID=2926618 RepID=UPI001F5AEBFC|nr:SEFIR domain-containing protein [Saccharopolyspora soli]MCI2420110.1 TIR domain-containing protein [Saccharopolyspora soli]
MSSNDNQHPRVFVSYTHDSEHHKKQVLEFGTFLRNTGIDARMDRWDTDRRRDWYSWAIREMTGADYVIVVASPKYRYLGDGNAASPQHRGIQSEAALLRELLHSDRETWLPRLLPVVLPGRGVNEIPLFLQPYTADHYWVTEFSESGADDLLRAITARPGHPRPPLHLATAVLPAGGVVEADQAGTVDAGDPESPTSGLFEMVDALLAVPSMAEDDTRRILVGQLRSDIAGAIAHHSKARLHVINIVNTCRNYEGGLAMLLSVIEDVEGDSVPVRRLRQTMANVRGQLER